ncbi:hypothetical protein B0H67DRAFT_481684 [Lasiosphaeris hirsuta]|uniref:Cyanovirin-N domain-containing protein n=1 Tax=Lasiosphaeris hirsuta TaxID=260670 RepID=A0AA40AZW1_9PEZI|nr:hypothetical protein B0H67DRAFT_481684 [Lasiosphaeris hirsuta]
MHRQFIWSWLAVLSTPSLAMAKGNRDFSTTCTRIELSRFTLGAQCFATMTDHTFINHLDLNLCIGLDQTTAELQWSIYGKFSNYCAACTLETGLNRLTCICSSLSGRVRGVTTTINLDEGIGNDNGVLTCMGGIASAEEVIG